MMIKSLQKYYIRISRNSSRSAVTYVESMYNAWRRDPKSVHRSWDAYFRNSPSFDIDEVEQVEKKSFVRGKESRYGGSKTSTEKIIDEYVNLQKLIRNYQTIGYSIAKSTEFDMDEQQDPHEELIADANFSSQDWERRFRLPSTTLIGGKERSLELKEIIRRLQNIYCRDIGVEYMFLESPEECAWIQEQIENPYARKSVPEQHRQILMHLAQAVGFEEFLSQNFQIDQNISLAGCEMLVPLLNKIIDLSCANGVKSFVMGLPKRGRLNILANVCKKPLKEIFSLFNGTEGTEYDDLDDFKYSLGAFVESVNDATKKNINFTVLSSLTNFQAIVPIVMGRTCAGQFLSQDYSGSEVMSILVHDNADFYAPGIAYETMHLSTLPNYKTNGTIHIVTNTNAIDKSQQPHANQYYRNLSRILNAPVFHVNANSPDAVAYVCKIASEWRTQFRRDIIIELDVYPRSKNDDNNGIFSNRTDKKESSCFEKYISKLTQKFSAMIPQAEATIDTYKELCQNALDATARWKPYDGSLWHEINCSNFQNISTGVDEKTLTKIGNSFLSPPKYEPHFVMRKSIYPIMVERKTMLEKKVVDWNLAEALAFGSLLKEKIPVRLAIQNDENFGDESKKRHHIIHHQKKPGKIYNLLQNISPKQSPYIIFNNMNNEAASLAFEFGYSIANPNMLVLWEAPSSFDYTSTAQTIIDQFIATGQAKWKQQSSLVMLIQYGLDSSPIRLERFLQMCSDSPTDVPYDESDNMENQIRDINWIIANCTTPANYFHILRRQLSLPFRKPLILMVSDMLLTLGEVTSNLDKLNDHSGFQALIPECVSDENCCTDNFRRLIFCSGRIYFDLVRIRAEKKLENEIAIARVEQLAPFPYILAGVEVKFFEHADLVWVQEEPKNQGAWSYVYPRLQTIADNRDINCIGRPCSELSLPISKAQHKNELKALLEEAMSVDTYW